MAEKSSSSGYESEDYQMEEGAGLLWNLPSPVAADGEDETGRFPMPGGSAEYAEENIKGSFKNLAIRKIVEEKGENGVVLTDVVMEAKVVEDGEITPVGTEAMDGKMTMEPTKLCEAQRKGEKTPENRGVIKPGNSTPKSQSSRNALLKNLYSRIVALENKQDTIAKNVERLGLSMREMEEKGGEKPNGALEGDRTRPISRDQMIAYVVEAIASAQTEIGCSKAYIRKFLFDRYDIPLTPHYVKKTNAALQFGCAEKKFEFDAKYGLFRL